MSRRRSAGPSNTILFSPSSERTVFVHRKRYGALSFLFDILMCVLTGGLWLIWIFVREMRGR